ncbi:uncharacterized protein BCR38DRAFT_323127, partial [Pseudomassariella vexata]
MLATGTSMNYKGNPFLAANQSANIPEHENCSLWLTNLPPGCTVHKLLSCVRSCGKVFACVINPPVPGATISTTSAAKLVFFNRVGAQTLLDQARLGQFAVDSYVPRVRSNRIKSAARTPGPQCRVLHIEGPVYIVNEKFLREFFRSKFQYDLDDVFLLSHGEGRARLEWRFGSYRCQAEAARTAIAKE